MEELYKLVRLGEKTWFKTALNHGLAALKNASRTWFRPHVCLNGVEGIENWRQIAADPEEADTEYWIETRTVDAGRDIWLNLYFWVYLKQVDVIRGLPLSPQQTSYLVCHLPEQYRLKVLDQIKDWYFGHYLPEHQKALATIALQFENGELLKRGTHENRVFDLHGDGIGHDLVHYTEPEVIGGNLFSAVVFGGTFWEYSSDGFEMADTLIMGRRQRQQDAVDDFLGKR